MKTSELHFEFEIIILSNFAKFSKYITLLLNGKLRLSSLRIL